MPRLFDADKVAEAIAWLDEYDFVIWHDVMECINKVPTVDAEPTEEQVKEYCRKRCLAIVDSELFDEMQARWSAEPVVQCKDCKHNSLNRKSGNAYCDLGIGLFQLYDYCSHGERREDAR